MKLTSLSSITLSIAMLVSNMTIVNGQQGNEAENTEFCYRSPYNQKCKNFNFENIKKLCTNYPNDKRCANRGVLIALENRPGESFYCQLLPAQSEERKKCKILIKDQKIIAYLETGEESMALGDREKTEDIIIDISDIFSFNSQWWLANVGNQEESVGMFADIQIGYLLGNSRSDNQSNFLTISANEHGDKGASNENIPKILEELEPLLYHNRDVTAIASRLKPELDPASDRVIDNVRRLLDTKECARCNLSGADLVDTDLEGANLEGANLEGANLEGAKLGKAYLLGANLDNANLYRADLEYSIMFLSSLENSNLAEANLRAANLQYSNLKGADLTVAQLDGITLNVTQLQNANLAEANLTEANLTCANLDSANLKNANLTKAKLGDCKPGTSIKKGKIISSFLLNNAKISTPFRDIADVLKGASAVISFISSSLDDDPYNYDTSGFDDLGLRGVEFIGATNLNNANLSGANLTEADLDGADLFNSNLSNAILDSTDLKETDLTNSNLINAQINDLKLEEAFLCNTIMPDVSIAKQGCLIDESATEDESDELEEAN